MWFVMTGIQVCCVYSYFNFMIRLQNLIMFSSMKTFGKCEAQALEFVECAVALSAMCSQGFGEKVRSSNC